MADGVSSDRIRVVKLQSLLLVVITGFFVVFGSQRHPTPLWAVPAGLAAISVVSGVVLQLRSPASKRLLWVFAMGVCAVASVFAIAVPIKYGS